MASLPLATLLACLVPPAVAGDLPTVYELTVEGLAGPVDLAWTPAGELLVLERDACHLRRLVPDGAGFTSAGTWGGRGSGDGELLFPEGLALAQDGCIWIADTGNRRVVRWSADGEYLCSLDGSRDVGGPFLRPVDVAVRAGRMAVADEGAHGVFRFTLDPEGRPADPTEPGPLIMLGGHGTQEHSLMSPAGVAFDDGGNLVVVDTENHRLRVYDESATPVAGWGGWGWYPGLFSTPVSVAAVGDAGSDGSGGLLYVADRENHRIQVFDGKGELKHRFGLHALKPGQGEGHLHYPSAVAVSKDGSRLAVAEPLDDRVQVFRPARAGDVLPPRVPDWQANSASAHFGPLLCAGGNLLAVTEPETHGILIYEDSWREPRQVSTLGGFGSPWGQFRRPVGIDWNPATSTLVVSDRGNRRLQVFRLGEVDAEEPAFDARLSRFVAGLDLLSLAPPAPQASAKGEGEILDPGPLTRNAAGDLIMLDPVARALLYFDAHLAVLGRRQTRLRDPRDLAVAGDGTTVLVTDAALPGIVALCGRREETALVDGSTGLVEPQGICVDGKGRIWVVDAGAHALFRFLADGTPDGRWGRRGLGRMEFNRPRGVALDGRGRLVISDHGNHRLMTINTEGEYVGVFGPRLYTHAARFPGLTPANGASR